MKKKYAILLSLIFVLFVSILPNSINDDEKTTINDTFILSDSSNYKYTENHTIIDGAATTNTSYSGNWTWAANNYDWCSGSGVWGDPYIIDNVSFNGGTLKNGLEIKNSRNSYFEINNCKGSSISGNYGGFALISVSNGTLSNNTACFNYFGIILYGSSNCTLMNSNISSNYHFGIYLKSSINCTILQNDINKNTDLGLYLEYANNCTVIGNTLVNNPLVFSSSFNNKIDITNTLDGKSIYYYEGDDGSIINNILDGVLILVNCSNLHIVNLEISHVSIAIYISSSTNITIENTTISHCYFYGILLIGSNNCTLIHSDILYNEYRGVFFYIADNSTIEGNQFSHNVEYGIQLIDSFYCSFTDNNLHSNMKYSFFSDGLKYSILEGNNISHNQYGLMFYSAVSCQISSNNISYNEAGIYFDQGSQYNEIWLNYISNNSVSQSGDDGNDNTWSKSEVGNFWGDYPIRYPDAQNIRGIWNIPYYISGSSNSVDKYPLGDYPPKIMRPPRPYIIILVVVGVLSICFLGLIYKNKNLYRPYLQRKI